MYNVNINLTKWYILVLLAMTHLNRDERMSWSPTLLSDLLLPTLLSPRVETMVNVVSD